MLQIRPANAEDVPILFMMIRELAEFERESASVTIQPDELARDGFGDNPLYRALVAEWEGEVVGYAVLFPYYSTWAGRGLFLEDLFVRDAFRHRGLGRPFWQKWRGLR